MTPQQIIDALRELAVEMQALGATMDYYGGHGEMAQHGRELVRAGATAWRWADGLTQERSGGAA